MSNLFRCGALLSALLVCGGDAAAQAQPAPDERAANRSRATQVLTFLAGGASGLVLHEAGHVTSGLIAGANPGFKRLDYGIIPFFAVTHDTVSRRREYLISSSGFHAQHLANEWLIGSASTKQSAFRQGWLTFNLATSAVYTAAALGTFGPAERDTRGMAISVGEDGIAEPVIGVLILAPAVLDGLRYLKDDPAWARWTSRAVKAGLVLLAVR